ncbi:hypothetical protein HZH66_012188 [Vespula vulgaris]|uniref:Uncharacterized protein n=1 Tax=Vespula vulgaris TaxID=7454 RepID=A0A834JBX3_VESVU|nr:hypothetical protein HZH66_012188 [Vespula vulgaris]
MLENDLHVSSYENFGHRTNGTAFGVASHSGVGYEVSVEVEVKVVIKVVEERKVGLTMRPSQKTSTGRISEQSEISRYATPCNNSNAHWMDGLAVLELTTNQSGEKPIENSLWLLTGVRTKASLTGARLKLSLTPACSELGSWQFWHLRGSFRIASIDIVRSTLSSLSRWKVSEKIGTKKDISRHGLKPLARPTSRRSRYQELMRNPVFKRTWLKPSLQENLAVGSQRAGRKNWSTEFHTESAIYN